MSVKVRLQQKIDTTANWALATTFKPLRGEIIIYSDAASDGGQRIKIGDGTTLVKDLPFTDEYITSTKIDEICV